MSGRMIHDQKGRLNFQPYGQSDEEVIYSISRAKLNQELMSLAESTGKISIFFEHKLLDCDFENKILYENLKLKKILIGNDFRYGNKRKGDIETLKSFCEKSFNII